MYEKRVGELTNDINKLRAMLDNNFDKSDVMRDLNAQLKEKDNLINERDEYINKVAAEKNLSEDQVKDLRAKLEKAGTSDLIARAKTMKRGSIKKK